jgi:hypothetical protein
MGIKIIKLRCKPLRFSVQLCAITKGAGNKGTKKYQETTNKYPTKLKGTRQTC